MDFQGSGIIFYFENGRMVNYIASTMDSFQDKLLELTQRIPKAHIGWTLINWDEHSLQVARGETDA